MATGGGWDTGSIPLGIFNIPCGNPECFCAPKVKPPPTFEERVIALAKVIWENTPYVLRTTPTHDLRYTWSAALSDATDIILASDHIFEENCTCD